METTGEVSGVFGGGNFESDYPDLIQVARGNGSQFEKRENSNLPVDPAQLPDRPEMKVV